MPHSGVRLVRIPIRLIRVHRFKGTKSEEMGELAIRQDKDGVHVFMTKGGETGFENFTIRSKDKVHPHEWCACVGREGEYDTVIVPQDEMERAYREAGIIEVPVKSIQQTGATVGSLETNKLRRTVSDEEIEADLDRAINALASKQAE